MININETKHEYSYVFEHFTKKWGFQRNGYLEIPWFKVPDGEMKIVFDLTVNSVLGSNLKSSRTLLFNVCFHLSSGKRAIKTPYKNDKYYNFLEYKIGKILPENRFEYYELEDSSSYMLSWEQELEKDGVAQLYRDVDKLMKAIRDIKLSARGARRGVLKV